MFESSPVSCVGGKVEKVAQSFDEGIVDGRGTIPCLVKGVRPHSTPRVKSVGLWLGVPGITIEGNTRVLPRS